MKPFLVTAMALLVAATAAADTFVVTKETDDDGPCTPDDCALREAVLAANALPGPDVIEIPGGTYQLSLVGPVPEELGQTGDLDIVDDVTIQGDTQLPVTVVGDGTDRVFHILGGTTVEMSHLTITGGTSQAGGGGIVDNGLYFTLRDSTITGNFSAGDGGGIFVGAGRQHVIERCTISNNRTARIRQGGGIFSGLSNVFSFLDIRDSTVHHNSAGQGGGIYAFGTANYNLVNLTISDNEGRDIPFSDGLVGDLANRLTLTNSLFVNNECGYILSIPQSNGHNMEGPTDTCFVPGTTDRRGVADLLLGPLADNGGPTMTQALLAGSPAIDAGRDADCPPVDQRGVARPMDGDVDRVPRCDIGAFEVEGPGALAIPATGTLGLLFLALLVAAGGVAALRR